VQQQQMVSKEAEHKLCITIVAVGEHALAYHNLHCQLQRLINSSQANLCCIKLPWHVIAVHAHQTKQPEEQVQSRACWAGGTGFHCKHA